MTHRNGFPATFRTLRALFKGVEKGLHVVRDRPCDYYVNAGWDPKRRQPVYFGGVQIRKHYVSFHLMPVYLFPDLLKGMSAGLHGRMQGKSCFNFRTAESARLRELSVLVRKGFERFRKEGFLDPAPGEQGAKVANTRKR